MNTAGRLRRWALLCWACTVAGAILLSTGTAQLASGPAPQSSTNGSTGFHVSNIGYELGPDGMVSAVHFTVQPSGVAHIAIWFGYHYDPNQTGAIYSTTAGVPNGAVQACTLSAGTGRCDIREAPGAITKLYAQVWWQAPPPPPPPHNGCTVDCNTVNLTPPPPSSGPSATLGEVWGLVSYDDGSIPQNATVTLDGGRPQHLASTGYYRFAGTALGQHTVAVSLNGATVERVTVDGVRTPDLSPSVDLTASVPDHRVDFLLTKSTIAVAPPPPAAGHLAATGGNSYGDMLLGALLLLVGLVLAGWRRRTESRMRREAALAVAVTSPGAAQEHPAWTPRRRGRR